MLGEMVFLKHDQEQNTWMVTAIILRPGRIQYEVCSGEKNLHVDAIELSSDKKIF